MTGLFIKTEQGMRGGGYLVIEPKPKKIDIDFKLIQQFYWTTFYWRKLRKEGKNIIKCSNIIMQYSCSVLMITMLNFYSNDVKLKSPKSMIFSFIAKSSKYSKLGSKNVYFYRCAWSMIEEVVEKMLKRKLKICPRTFWL